MGFHMLSMVQKKIHAGIIWQDGFFTAEVHSHHSSAALLQDCGEYNF